MWRRVAGQGVGSEKMSKQYEQAEKPQDAGGSGCNCAPPDPAAAGISGALDGPSTGNPCACNPAEAAWRTMGAQALRLASIAEVLDEAIALTGAAGRIEWVNAAMMRLTGRTAAQSMGMEVPALLFPDDPVSAAQCQGQIDAPRVSRDIVLPIRGSSGISGWFELQFKKIPAHEDSAVGTVVVVRNITQDHQTPPVVRVPVDAAVPANDRREPPPSPGNAPDRGAIDFDLFATVEDLIASVADQAHRKRIEIVCAFAPGLPAMVRGDPAPLRQVLLDIVGNAIRFTERGEVVLSVEPLDDQAVDGTPVADTTPAGAPATQVRFTVRDSGMGIRPEALQQWLPALAHADPSPARRHGDKGRGLATSRQLVYRMGGQISATSRIGEGTAFQVDLPLRRSEAPAAALPAPAGVLAGKRVLIADDNPTSRRILHEQLGLLQMDCALAENGPQAWQMLRIAVNSPRAFDIAVIDMRMPTLDGLALCEQIRADPALAPLPLVLLTSITEADEALRAQSVGADALLPKPLRRRDLGITLATVLGRGLAAHRPYPTVERAAGPAGRGVPVAADSGTGITATPPTAALLPLLPRDGAALEPAAARAAPVLDESVLDDILAMERNGARNLLRRLVETYATSSAALVAAADRGFVQQDAAVVAQAVHTLKSSSANLGALVFSRGCARIELLARQADLAAAAPLWYALRDSNSGVIAALRALLPPGPAAGSAAAPQASEIAS